MRKTGLAAVLFAITLAGCHHRGGNHVSGGVLGRVVIYRNGVAFYERTAQIVDGRLAVRVPRERVDDFLKSLTVVDQATGQPLSVSIPRTQGGDGTSLTMLLETPYLQRANVLLTYVTEAPAWKPSYRIVVGKDGKMMLEGWAVVDNTTSEDWKGVLVGVGASSALAFRYDLWSVHTVDRDLLQPEERFVVAPPAGVSPYSDTNVSEELVAFHDGFSGKTSLDNQYYVDGTNTTGLQYGTTGAPIPNEPSAPATSSTTGAMQGAVSENKTGEKLAGVTIVASSPSLTGTQTAITDENGYYKLPNLPPGQYTVTFFYGDLTVERKAVNVAVGKATPVFQKLDYGKSGGEIVIVSGNQPTIDTNYSKNIPVPARTFETALGASRGSQGDSTGAKHDPGPTSSTTAVDQRWIAIAAKVQKDKRDIVIEVHGSTGTEKQAIERGTAIKNKLVDHGIGAKKIHIVPKIGPGQAETVRVLAIAPSVKPETAIAPPASRISPGDHPVGESHFVAEKPMTVRSGSSAMVATLHRETTGGIVYLYDPISDRGHARFAFRSVRLDNPTADTLEPGPVTVYGDGKFIGEGITEPVPPHAVAVIPFALDKQVIIERTGAETDQIAKLVTMQRGVLTAEVQHRRDSKFAITSRLAVPTTVFLRHRLEKDWLLLDHPEFTRVGDSHLFRVDLRPGETKHVTVSEATPIERTFDLGTPEALGMMKVFINEPKASRELKKQVEALLATHRTAADLVDKIATLREQLAEYRARSGELHAQVMTLKAVRTGGELLATLKAKMAEMSDRTQKATIAIVEAQEQLMLSRVKFQNQIADLRLTDQTEVSKK